MGVHQRNQPYAVEPGLGKGLIHVRGTAVPPRASPIGGRRPRPNLFDPCRHQIPRSSIDTLPLPPQKRPQFAPEPTIEFLHHVIFVGSTPQCSVQVLGFANLRLLTLLRRLYPLPVRQSSALPAASSGFHLAMDTLAVRLILPLAGCVEDLHLQVSAPCRAHE